MEVCAEDKSALRDGDEGDEDTGEQGAGYLAGKDQPGSSTENINLPYEHIRHLRHN